MSHLPLTISRWLQFQSSILLFNLTSPWKPFQTNSRLSAAFDRRCDHRMRRPGRVRGSAGRLARCGPRLRACAAGVAAGDEVIVITWLHRGNREVLQVHPRGDPEIPIAGVFATRSPDRPNPLGLHRVTVRRFPGRDCGSGRSRAIDGTPVVDIKAVLEDTEWIGVGSREWVSRATLRRVQRTLTTLLPTPYSLLPYSPIHSRSMDPLSDLLRSRPSGRRVLLFGRGRGAVERRDGGGQGTDAPGHADGGASDLLPRCYGRTLLRRTAGRTRWSSTRATSSSFLMGTPT